MDTQPLLDGPTTGQGAALQRLGGKTVSRPRPDFAVENLAVRQLRRRGDEVDPTIGDVAAWPRWRSAMRWGRRFSV
ncbi:hypothetical protein [Streptomyces sp. A0592]|uniref:hypothetical protein n=1 Tax=Streptomyces sp. A0592 TaxID=2563099 RepID=UPI00109E595F|nr:hypothetical protein [Streptomyces sp. A0592]THA77828.1 hypothetical protein E6U81_34255 [Streptomyces sp. A0592]